MTTIKKRTPGSIDPCQSRQNGELKIAIFTGFCCDKFVLVLIVLLFIVETDGHWHWKNTRTDGRAELRTPGCKNAFVWRIFCTQPGRPCPMSAPLRLYGYTISHTHTRCEPHSVREDHHNQPPQHPAGVRFWAQNVHFGNHELKKRAADVLWSHLWYPFLKSFVFWSHFWSHLFFQYP